MWYNNTMGLENIYRNAQSLTLKAGAAAILANPFSAVSLPSHQFDTGRRIDPDNLAAMNDDIAINLPGCDATIIVNTTTGAIEDVGKHRSSPAREAATSDFSTIIAMPGNGNRGLAVSQLIGDNWVSALYTGNEKFVYQSGAAFTWDDKGLLAGQIENVDDDEVVYNNPKSATSIALYEPPTIKSDGIVELNLIDKVPVDGIPVGIFPIEDNTTVYAVVVKDGHSGNTVAESKQWGDVTIYKLSIMQFGQKKRLRIDATFSAGRINTNITTLRLAAEHVISPVMGLDGKIWINGVAQGEITIVDPVEKTLKTLKLEPEDTRIFGMSHNYTETNTGLIAIHRQDAVVIGKMDSNGNFQQLSRTPIPAPPLFITSGPYGRVEWSGDGTEVIVATKNDFHVFSVNANGILKYVRSVIICPVEHNSAQDIRTTNLRNRRRPNPTPTATEVVEVTPTSRPETATPTVTITPQPKPTKLKEWVVYLPVVAQRIPKVEPKPFTR